MPLIKSSSKTARARNVRRLLDEGYPPRQAVAIAYSTQRAAAAQNRAGKRPVKMSKDDAAAREAVLSYFDRYVWNRGHLPRVTTGFMRALQGWPVRDVDSRDGGHLAFFSSYDLAESVIREAEKKHRAASQNRAGGKRRNRSGDSSNQYDVYAPSMVPSSVTRDGDGRVVIEYGAKVYEDGWRPIIWVYIDGQRIRDFFWSPRAFDRDTAIKMAAHLADEQSKKYIGDWSISIRAARADRGERR